jgi:hypothetical protein
MFIQSWNQKSINNLSASVVQPRGNGLEKACVYAIPMYIIKLVASFKKKWKTQWTSSGGMQLRSGRDAYKIIYYVVYKLFVQCLENKNLLRKPTCFVSANGIFDDFLIIKNGSFAIHHSKECYLQCVH